MNPRRQVFHFGAALLLVVALLQGQTQKPPRVELKFAILGDTGTGTPPQYDIGKKLAANHATFPFEFVIMLGDNMYGGESPKDFQNKFEKPYEALLSMGMKFYASLGNHDIPDREIAYKLFN